MEHRLDLLDSQPRYEESDFETQTEYVQWRQALREGVLKTLHEFRTETNQPESGDASLDQSDRREIIPQAVSDNTPTTVAQADSGDDSTLQSLAPKTGQGHSPQASAAAEPEHPTTRDRFCGSLHITVKSAGHTTPHNTTMHSTLSTDGNGGDSAYSDEDSDDDSECEQLPRRPQDSHHLPMCDACAPSQKHLRVRRMDMRDVDSEVAMATTYAHTLSLDVPLPTASVHMDLWGVRNPSEAAYTIALFNPWQSDDLIGCDTPIIDPSSKVCHVQMPTVDMNAKMQWLVTYLITRAT
ncbi:hypothetical protein SARC_11588 [Sphaeroforma arctica JP610]|uniref:Uncharacterized protein n=1 Tax=Sphaeroforma arctica JP610 TaxID=667725 RepID=A0A0L0FGI5_9EUKA|nr:hypothetical protein SARC_11588 [Sphaeroforma arctica JP610]KNC75894.1 hypothetical protein SARC_11588 [Sphaeroforma arctica JP610]|eukprot:XP_014149796.1 hypothetical protein SARC_11588 [Sphaeroforma arctica JP610]